MGLAARNFCKLAGISDSFAPFISYAVQTEISFVLHKISNLVNEFNSEIIKAQERITSRYDDSKTDYTNLDISKLLKNRPAKL